ncbi:MAG TPA: carboxypeptidase regulatory-like domain-containing protein, partial [Bryobacteraceae bacterium]|nr:carboxypeptidase regulatory-like domain-containing protein [Bryobacteraceae bacterium]
MKQFGIQICVLLLALGCAISATAQTDRATVTGTVTDSTGAVMPNASVTMTNAGTKAVFTTPTNGNGVYTIPSLPVGLYTLEVRHEGFKTYTRTGIAPVAGQVITADVRMDVGEAAETVTVTGTPVLEVANETESMTMEESAIRSLPLNANGGRNAINLLVATAPNVSEATINSAGTQNWISIAGGSTFSNSIFI